MRGCEPLSVSFVALVAFPHSLSLAIAGSFWPTLHGPHSLQSWLVSRRAKTNTRAAKKNAQRQTHTHTHRRSCWCWCWWRWPEPWTWLWTWTEVHSNQQPSTKYKSSSSDNNSNSNSNSHRKASLGPLPFSISAKFGLQHAAKLDRIKKGRHLRNAKKWHSAAAAFSFSSAAVSLWSLKKRTEQTKTKEFLEEKNQNKFFNPFAGQLAATSASGALGVRQIGWLSRLYAALKSAKN